MWRASVFVLVACSASRVGPSPEPPTRESPPAARSVTPPVVLAPVVPVVHLPDPVEPLPFAPDPPDDGTTAGAVRIPHPIEVAIPYDEADELSIEDLPAKNAAWKRRSTIHYAGHVPLTFGLRNGRLRMYIEELDAGMGVYRGFDLTWTSDATVLHQLHDQKPPYIHALLHVRPTDSSPDSERVHVAVYTPPDENVVLVATRRDTAKRWRPLLRIDAPNAEELTLHVSEPH